MMKDHRMPLVISFILKLRVVKGSMEMNSGLVFPLPSLQKYAGR